VQIGEPNIKRIDSTNPDQHASYLWRKITATTPYSGVQMPAGNGVLAGADILTIQNWIQQGAPNN
jgi:hypothetical protein